MGMDTRKDWIANEWMLGGYLRTWSFVIMTCAKQKERDYIRKRISPLTERSKINETIKFCSSLYIDENDRKMTIEGKANNLIASVGMVTAFIVGFLGLMFRPISKFDGFLFILICILYIIIVIHLLLCIFYALKTVSISKYRYAMPEPEDIYNLKNKNIVDVRKERAIDYLVSYFNNRDMNDKKATSLRQAQEKLNTCLIFLALLPLLFCINFFIR
jgi:hypothetical protein